MKQSSKINRSFVLTVNSIEIFIQALPTLRATFIAVMNTQKLSII
jgi:hypothetical protein